MGARGDASQCISQCISPCFGEKIDEQKGAWNWLAMCQEELSKLKGSRKSLPRKVGMGVLHSLPLQKGCRGGWWGAHSLWGCSACREEHPTAAAGDQREPEHRDGLSGFVLAYCSLGPSKCLEHQLSPNNTGTSKSQCRAELSSPW